MRLTLLVPGLLLPGEVLADTVFDLAAPTLSLILGRSRRKTLPPDWLAATFGCAAPLPAAALRKLGAGEAAQTAEPRKVEAAQTAEPRKEAASGEWICLDPVHWQVTREGVTLDDPAGLRLDDAEAAALIEAVRPLFADWGVLSASAPGHWEMRLARPLALETMPLPEAIRQPVSPALPGGADGRAWRRLLAEAQTVLHAHPVNRRRDALDKPPVNSLWPWGQGALPEAAAPAGFAMAWSDDPIIAGLCAHAGLPCLAPPERFQPAGGSVLATVAALAQPAHSLDALAWREALLAVERDWLAPAFAALKRGECAALQLVGTRLGCAPAAVSFSLARGDLLRFWRRPRPLATLAEPA